MLAAIVLILGISLWMNRTKGGSLPENPMPLGTPDSFSLTSLHTTLTSERDTGNQEIPENSIIPIQTETQDPRGISPPQSEAVEEPVEIKPHFESDRFKNFKEALAELKENKGKGVLSEAKFYDFILNNDEFERPPQFNLRYLAIFYSPNFLENFTDILSEEFSFPEVKSFFEALNSSLEESFKGEFDVARDNDHLVLCRNIYNKNGLGSVRTFSIALASCLRVYRATSYFPSYDIYQQYEAGYRNVLQKIEYIRAGLSVSDELKEEADCADVFKNQFEEALKHGDLLKAKCAHDIWQKSFYKHYDESYMHDRLNEFDKQVTGEKNELRDRIILDTGSLEALLGRDIFRRNIVIEDNPEATRNNIDELKGTMTEIHDQVRNPETEKKFLADYNRIIQLDIICECLRGKMVHIVVPFNYSNDPDFVVLRAVKYNFCNSLYESIAEKLLDGAENRVLLANYLVKLNLVCGPKIGSQSKKKALFSQVLM